MKFTNLFTPIRIGGAELANRIVMPPITTSFYPGGFVTDTAVEHYAVRSRGGAGLIIIEDAIIESSAGRHAPDDLCADDDKYLPGLSRLAREVKAGGAKVALNLSHGGMAAGKPGIERTAPPVSASPVAESAPGSVVSRELGIGEIEELEDKFARAAVRAREAGFDMLSLHAAHSYLINQFLSPAYNRRQDIYGKDANGRMRFLLEIIRKIKKAAGDDYPMIVRIPVEEHGTDGLSIEDSREIARRLEAAGVHCLSASVNKGADLSRVPPTTAPMRSPRACMVYLAEALKPVVSVPVMTANRIVTPAMAEQVLVEGKADLIGIGRGLLADPEWPLKAREGREDEIRHCIACNYCLSIKGPRRCTVNVGLGREAEAAIIPAGKVKKVFIAGGGAAGMEAARVAALRGHRVSLFEKGRLGGQLNIACVPPGRSEIGEFLDFEKRQVQKLGVDVRNAELIPETVTKERPDAVIIATGASPAACPIPGADNKNVFTAWQVLAGEAAIGDKVAVLGGGLVGAETAEYLAAQGKRVTLVEMLNDIASDEYRYAREMLLLSLKELEVDVLSGTAARAIKENGVEVDRQGKSQLIEADSVVLALGSQSEAELASRLEGLVTELYLAGDCLQPRKLANAVEEGFQAAAKL